MPDATEPRPQELHLYVFTIAGTCAQCNRPEAAHVKRLVTPNELTECILDHESLESKHVLGDAGLRWSHCPYCNVMVEPKLATGETTGKSDGRGRGGLSMRHKEDLRKVERREAFNRWMEARDGAVES